MHRRLLTFIAVTDTSPAARFKPAYKSTITRVESLLVLNGHFGRKSAVVRLGFSQGSMLVSRAAATGEEKPPGKDNQQPRSRC